MVKPPKRPTRQVCALCGSDDFVTLGSDGPDLWKFTCTGTHHYEPYVWQPTAERVAAVGRSGMGEDLGVYDDLLACVAAGERVEYGIVEHRFALRSPSTYRQLVETYGHTSIAPTNYSASSFLARALGQLSREGLLQLGESPATGFWSYNGTISSWGQPGEPETTPLYSWASFAAENDFDPTEWPATAGA
jgi:hypothetical protein